MGLQPTEFPKLQEAENNLKPYQDLWFLVRDAGAGPRLASLLVLLAALAGSGNWSFRPQLLIYPILADMSELVDDKFNTNYWAKIGVPSYGLSLGLTGRCTSYIRPNGVSN